MVRVRKTVLWRVVVMVVIEPSIALVRVATELVTMACVSVVGTTAAEELIAAATEAGTTVVWTGTTAVMM